MHGVSSGQSSSAAAHERPGRHLVQRVLDCPLHGIHLQDSAKQDVRSSGTVIPMSEFKRRVTDTSNARHEDHPHR